MSNITRLNPFSELASFDPFSDDFFRGFTLRPALRQLENEPHMRIEVTENDKAYAVNAEIPGVSKEDIHVSIDANQVSINAEVKKPKEQNNGGRVIRSERYYGNVSRSFSLGQNVEQDKASAKYENGILALTLPKKSGSDTKQLTIS